jgi:hypothetical protein
MSNWAIMCLLGGLAQSNLTVESIFRASRLAMPTGKMILALAPILLFLHASKCTFCQ